MVWSDRTRAEARDAAEAAGVDLWTSDFDSHVRGKLIAHYRLFCRNDYAIRNAIEESVDQIIQLATGNLRVSPIEQGLLTGNRNTVLDYVEAIFLSLKTMSMRPQDWAAAVNQIFNSHRVAYKFADGRAVPLASEELHTAIVEPVIQLLHGRPDLNAAQDAYREALQEISRNNAANAITDAGTALQETLTTLGCSGNALGPLIADARRQQIFGRHDEKLVDGIGKFLDWVSADRSENGDSHHASGVELDDAWLMVHIVGALIVRLTGPPRPYAQPKK
jgi:hypothetical protein